MSDNPNFDMPLVEFSVELPQINKLSYKSVVRDVKISDYEQSSEQKALVQGITNLVDKGYYEWKMDSDEYVFKLPESQFELQNKMEVIEIQLPEMEINCERRRLSSSQLKSIWEKGEFEVPSSLENINHVWKLSPFLFSGSKGRLEMFQKIFAAGLNLLYEIPNFYSLPELPEYYTCCSFKLNFWSGLLSLFSYFVNILDLIIGTRSMFLSQNFEYAVNNEIQKRRCLALLNRNFESSRLIAEYLQQYEIAPADPNTSLSPEYKEKVQMNKIIESQQKEVERIYNLIHSQWEDYFKSQVNDFEDVEEEEFNARTQELNGKKYQRMLDYLEQNNDMDSKLKEAFINKIKAFQVIESEIFKRNKKLAEERTHIHQNLVQNHPYLSKIGFWFKRNYEEQVAKVEERLTQDMNYAIINTLIKEGNQENAEMYRESMDAEEFSKHKIKEIECQIEQKLTVPALELKIYRRIYPPYEVIAYDEGSEKRYYFKTNTLKTVKSTFLFFRLWADIIRFVYWTIDLTYYSFRYAMTGSFGLKGLFYWERYHRDYSCDHNTGAIYNDRDEVNPVIVKFNNILEGISKSRMAFESSPDNGFFGKTVSRVFNLIECYILRLIIVGIFLVLLCHPLLNVIVTAVCLFLSFTSFVWVILWITICNLFRWLIYDYEALDYGNYLINDKRIRGFWNKLKSPASWFPLIILKLNCLLRGVFRVIWVFFLTLLYPVLALFIFLFAIFTICFKSIYDFIMFNLLIKCCAKVPQQDSAVAKRIAGPGISHNLFCNLSIDDAIILVQSLLEKIQLEKYQKQVIRALETPLKYTKNTLKSVMFPFLSEGSEYLNFAGIERIDGVTQTLIRSLQKQVSERMKQLPALRKDLTGFKIKFFDEELTFIKNICLQILRKNLMGLKIHDFIWQRYQIPEGKYKLLMSKVLKEAFGSETIFETVEETDQRIVLTERPESKMKKAIIVQRIIEGQEKLSTLVPTFKPKHNSEQAYISNMTLNEVRDYFQNKRVDSEGHRHVIMNVRVE